MTIITTLQVTKPGNSMYLPKEKFNGLYVGTTRGAFALSDLLLKKEAKIMYCKKLNKISGTIFQYRLKLRTAPA